MPYFPLFSLPFCPLSRELAKEMHIVLFAYVVLENHYHVLFSLYSQDELAFVTPKERSKGDNKGEKMVRFIRRLHTITAKKLNDEDHMRGRTVWYQYWDYCVRNKADFWSHFNYIIKNPHKHGLVESLDEAYSYIYSSNPVWLKRFGKDGLWESFVRYPVKEVAPVE